MSKSELKRIKSQTDFNSIEILEAHNKWRRGADIEMQSPYLIGLAIDEAIDALKEQKNEQTTAIPAAHPG